MINYVVPATELDSKAQSIAAEILTNSPLVIALLKEQLQVLGEAYPLSPATFERLQGMRREIYDSEDYREGIQAFFERRPPKFTGQ
jgi:methylmalonyl-CoA decarboxylase